MLGARSQGAVAVAPGNVGVWSPPEQQVDVEFINTANSRWRLDEFYLYFEVLGDASILPVGLPFPRWVYNATFQSTANRWGFQPEKRASLPFPDRE